MLRERLIYGAVAGVVGVVVGIGAVFLGGQLAAENKPSTDVNSFNAENGFVQGSVDYGSRGGGDGANH
ncbi:DUF2613 family protein [Gordonia sp. (in: high G+C Gram-positive bacteria)]|uniref:DUF2613 family protein n=1 Tax=Gordonia sp. (in: high G+C Gram-positive bacteria) TaxID=84139 RepID=UPI00169CA80F|nr:DUF2613 family protein [Gordonia sp. (in: high G+C Gram-positive bacteria)]NLG47854.1 DUF2613 family protein [Gordonia sp. (in: high G+C Gram-positive bacteria)]